jgi:hypothetical protein
MQFAKGQPMDPLLAKLKAEEEVEQEGHWGYRIIGTGSYLQLLGNAGDSLLPGVWCPQRGF